MTSGRGSPTDDATLLSLRPSLWFIPLHRGGWLLTLLILSALCTQVTVTPGFRAAWDRLTLVPAALAMLLLLFNAADFATRRYTLTSTRVLRVSGVLRRVAVEAPLGNIQSLTMLASIRERVFGLGTVAFSTAGSSGFEFTWYMIAKPQAAIDAVRAQMP